MSRLPPLMRPELEQIEDRSPSDPDGGFLSLHRLLLRRGGGPPFEYDFVVRDALDAVVMLAHFKRDGVTHVYLRSAVRPPAAFRPLDRRPFAEPERLGHFWELPAGLVEPAECSPEGLRRCAARELEEELGFQVEPSRLSPLGPSTFPTAGVIGERHHFFHVLVEPEARGVPTLDGSALEEDASVIAIPLDHALDATRHGEIEDAKTELGLRRLAELG
ncbi:MAG: NUDIX hydrolase [Myxococcota bacterium]